MLEIEFYLDKPQTNWTAQIHQLNSDILRRHILPKLQHTSLFIDFEYCEKSSQGAILCDKGSTLGYFVVK